MAVIEFLLAQSSQIAELSMLDQAASIKSETSRHKSGQLVDIPIATVRRPTEAGDEAAVGCRVNQNSLHGGRVNACLLPTMVNPEGNFMRLRTKLERQTGVRRWSGLSASIERRFISHQRTFAETNSPI
jgi:hypothetical protein